ncbi:hypothetical protein MSAN_00209300 [Mycena sanguinolenta]|uniref:Zn(2)-C6 fungal-type domain-containing protein n=1 Tax=Mycena sanguinolenta TaxID=230812 RepID=A0A8H6ZI82_9AGAR|nr:hypothetical protein MSAN_00209300 [Mycena sanguinolenta]
MDSKLKTPTCSRCKIRKIRCDGLEPCASCSTAAASCHYDPHAKESRFGIELRKGQACIACRRKKKRCDGQLPCRTCSSGRKKIPCEYPDNVLPLPRSDEATARIDVNPTNDNSSSNDPHTISFTAHSNNSSDTLVASGSSSTGSPTLLLTESTPASGVDDMVVDVLSPSPFTLPEIESPPTDYPTLVDLSQARDSFLNTTIQRKLVPATIPVNNEQGESSRLPSTEHIRLYTVEYPTQMPETHLEELSGMRRLFLGHRIQLGLSVPDAILCALEKGTSGDTVLHSALLHACQLLGYMLARHLHQSSCICLPGASERENEQLRLTFNALHNRDADTAPCPVAHLQTVTLLSLYFFNKGDIARARELILTGNTLVRAHDLDSMASNPAPSAEATRVNFQPKPTSEEGVTQAAVSQLVYLDLLYAITLKLPCIIDPVLRENFKKLIGRPNANPEVNYMRAKSAFLMYETQRLSAQWAQQPGLDESAIVEWQRTYWDVMEALDTHRSFITLSLTKLAFCPKMRLLGLSLKVCAVVVSTGAAALLSLFSADHPELRQKKYAAVTEVISISTLFSDADFEDLDPILSACWSAIISTLDQCIASCPDSKAKSMHDIPAMAGIMRQQNETLQRSLPFPVGV